MAGFSAWLLAALLAAGHDGQAQRAVAIFPVQVPTDRPDAADASRLLTHALTSRLGTTFPERVISADEVTALLEHERESQAMGCEETSCLAELAGALGAQLVVTSQVHVLGSTLHWTASLIDQVSTEVVRRAESRGPTVGALFAQAEEMALQLSGRSTESLLDGEGAARRLGFASLDGLAAFKAYRVAHPEVSTSEALTAFILERNLESRALAVAQAALFVLSALLVIPSPGLVCASVFIAPIALPVAAVPIACGWLGCAASSIAGVAALVTTVIDAFDRGRVKVREDGCCRDDAVLVEAASRKAFARAMALVVLLSGPVTVGAALSFFGAVAFLGANVVPFEPTNAPINDLTFVLLMAPVIAGLGALAVIAPIAGLWLLLHPDAPLLERVP